jgi:uncharacterized membrane protein affecting hemolysin expression
MKKKILIIVAILFVAFLGAFVYSLMSEHSENEKKVEKSIEKTIQRGKIDLKTPKIVKQPDKEKLRRLLKRKKKDKEDKRQKEQVSGNVETDNSDSNTEKQ